MAGVVASRRSSRWSRGAARASRSTSAVGNAAAARGDLNGRVVGGGRWCGGLGKVLGR